MGMGKAAVAIELTTPERQELESLARAHRTGQAMARRARIVLAAAAGLENKAICTEVGADANTVSKWRRRFAADRLDGLLDEPRPGTPRKIGDDEIAETIRLTLETAPPGATHWSLRSMAKAVGYAPSTIHRIWRAFGLQPHRGKPSGDAEGVRAMPPRSEEHTSELQSRQYLVCRLLLEKKKHITCFPPHRRTKCENAP